MSFTVEVNRVKRTVDVDGDMPLLWVLRDELSLKGSKFGCGVALCGACTVHLDAQPVRTLHHPDFLSRRSCRHHDRGHGCRPRGRKLQAAWMELDVPQCGYCQAGQIMSAADLLTKNLHPSDHEIDAAMAGNVCRCCSYLRIRAAIKRAATMLNAAMEK